MRKVILFIAAFFVLAGCASKLPPLPEAQAGPYKLGPGDEVRIEFFRLTELSNTYIVSDTGVISVPLIDPIAAGGKTIVELEQDLEREIKANNLLRNPDVSAQVSKYRPFYIVGEVQRPGQYDYQPNMSVLVALSVAGGPTFRANTDDIVITRMTEGELLKGRARPESLVMPGDTIEVKEGWF